MKLIIIALLFQVACFFSVTSVPCDFNSACDCEFGVVYCTGFSTFPTFSNSSYQIQDLTISGNFTYIPALAIYPLQGLQPNVEVEFQGSANDISAGLAHPLTVNESALHTYNNIHFLDILFTYFDFSLGLPNGAFANISCSKILFSANNIPTINDNAFNSFQTNNMAFDKCNISEIQPYAFNGIKFVSSAQFGPSTLVIAWNKITEISAAFKYLNVDVINLEQNPLTTIPDFAFCSCNAVGSCISHLQKLDLSSNAITSIGDKAFANLPNLTSLALAGSLLTSIPTVALSQVASTLVVLDFQGSIIDTVDVNSFLNFQSLTSLSLDYNPITEISPGAFNGMSAITLLKFESLNNLQTVDALITYGMNSIEFLEFSTAQNLRNITLSDYTKLPASLKGILIYDTDMHEISSEFKNWLDTSKSALDISQNKYFNCQNDIQWMAKYVLCNPVQILAKSTFCNGSTTSLLNYLSTFNPVCD